MTDTDILDLRRADPEFRRAREFWAMIPNCDLRRHWQQSGRQVGFREFLIEMAKTPEEGN